MIKSLNDARILDGLPRIVAGQDWVIALSDALGRLHEKTLTFADESQIYTALDTVSEEILDVLAVNWKIEWYDTAYSLEQKRRIVKSSLTVRRFMGTVYAVRLQADAIFPGTQLEEWFDYGGEPGTFRLFVDITTSSGQAPAHDYDTSEMERRLVAAKRWSAHLESFSHMVKNGIAIGCREDQWKYNVPLCGTIYCGQHWMSATIGYTENPGITVKPDSDAYVYMTDLTGTKPEISTKGYSGLEIIQSKTETGMYEVSPGESGTENTGTYPETATKGYSGSEIIQSGMESVVYMVSQEESGTENTGTRPEITTGGYSDRKIIKSSSKADAYTAELKESGTVPETAEQGYSMKQALIGGKESGNTVEVFKSRTSESGTRFCGAMQ